MKRSDHPKPEPTPALRPSRVIAEPATVQRCNDDYAAAAGDRRAMDSNIRRDGR